jgi:hypothetical protein
MKACSSRRHLTLRGTTTIADKAILNNLKVFEFGVQTLVGLSQATDKQYSIKD